MTIRFQCASCHQPIEVDDEWGQRMVACPYCNKTVTAPQHSTLGDAHEVPTASPVPSSGLPRPGYSAGGTQGLELVHPNRIALIGFVLACCGLAMAVAVALIARAHSAELVDLGTELEAMMKAGASQQQAMADLIEERWGGVPLWLVSLVLLWPASMVASLATIICSTIALRRVERRKLAVASLLIAGSIPVLFCFGSGSVLGSAEATATLISGPSAVGRFAGLFGLLPGGDVEGQTAFGAAHTLAAHLIRHA